MNTEITKYKNIPASDLLEGRILKLENLIQQLTAQKLTAANTDTTSKNPSMSNQNLAESHSDKLSLSEGQISAQIAMAMSRSNQRNS